MMRNKNVQLRVVTVIPRVFLALIYLAVTLCLIWKISSSSSIATATRQLHVNDVIHRDDLQTPETEALVGKFLQKDVARDQPVTPNIVGIKHVPSKVALPSVAVIIRVPSARLLQRSIQEGDSVLVKIPKGTLSGKVEKIDCDAQLCAVFISLAAPSAQTIDAQALAAADIEPETPQVP